MKTARYKQTSGIPIKKAVFGKVKREKSHAKRSNKGKRWSRLMQTSSMGHWNGKWVKCVYHTQIEMKQNKKHMWPGLRCKAFINLAVICSFLASVEYDKLSIAAAKTHFNIEMSYFVVFGAFDIQVYLHEENFPFFGHSLLLVHFVCTAHFLLNRQNNKQNYLLCIIMY